MARLELPASLLLLAPASDDKTSAGAEEDPESSGFTTVDSFEAIHTPPGDLKDARYSIDVSDLLHEGTTKVYRGTLSVDGRRHRNADVICKLARGKTSVEALHREADLYRGRLAPLQGRCVPTFLGLFGRETEGEERACLVVTYEGAVMQQSLYTSTIDFRKKVVNAILAVHKAGVHHGAFNEAHIVVRDGDNAPVLVGFSTAEEHVCHLGAPIEFYAPQPHSTVVGCEEVYWACVVAAAWLPATVEFLNTSIPVEWALEGFEELVARAPKGTDPDLARMHAELTREDLLEWIEERELYDGQPLPVKIAE
ncbi:hypothetical protein V8D89_006394 [Ganoderma adspersum]